MAPTQHQTSSFYSDFSPAYHHPYNNYRRGNSSYISSSSRSPTTDHRIHRTGKTSFITSSDASKKQRLPNPRRPLHSQSPPERHLSDFPPSPTTTTTTPQSSIYYFTWLVFLKEKWVPFDAVNQTKLEQTLTLGGTFVDVTDTHFPKVKRVRVFPRNNYLSYLGVKYRLSRIMQPDAWLDHATIYEARENDDKYNWVAD